MVGNICVHAATDKAKPIAIIVPVEPALKKIAETNGIEGNGVEDLVHSKQLNDIVLKELQSIGKQGGLTGIEIIEAVILADEEWTPANVSAYSEKHRERLLIFFQGFVTASQKLNRKVILKRYQKDVDKAYAAKS